MPYPSYSYLDQDTLRSALDMARSLHAAAEAIGELANGAAAGGRGDGGRSRDAALVVQDWIGHTRDTFGMLIDNERESVAASGHQLTEEAEAWSRFWAAASNACNDRLYDEAVRNYEASLGDYGRQLDTADGSGITERPPQPPVRSPPISPPTAAMNYHPPPAE